MPKYNVLTGKVELTEEEKQYMADDKNKKVVVKKAELQRPLTADWLYEGRPITFGQPQDYQMPAAEQPGPDPRLMAQPQQPEPWMIEATPARAVRVEAQLEGQQTVTRRRPAEEEETDTPVEWDIDKIVYRKNGLFEVLSHDTAGHNIRYAYEPYFDAYVTPRTAVRSISKKLMKTFAEKGLNVEPAIPPQKADLTEEMYQLLSIIMQDSDMRMKFGSLWNTVRNQYDSQF